MPPARPTPPTTSADESAAADRGEPARPGAAGGALPEVLRPAWAEIDLDALVANYRRLRDLVAPARVLAVIKADAYGHGAPEVSRALEAAGADLLGAALLEEGAEVRRAGVTTPLLILGVPRAAQLPYYRRYRLTPVVSGIDQLAMWLDWLAGAGEGAGSEPEGRYVQPIHLKVDTGMTRLGIAEAELPAALEMVRASPHLELAGLLSHLADADLLDSPRNQDQERRFARAVEALTAAERSRALLHLANSAGALHRPASRHDVVRLGLALYGYDPASDPDGSSAGLDPVMSVRTRTVLVREVPAGTRVSYGGRWTAPRPSRIGVLPVGYADGYAWRLSNRASALVRGRRLPLVGSVSMDMVFVDLTDLREAGEVVEVGEEVVLLGRQGGERITATELAAEAGTIPYELLCLLGLRLARRYLGGHLPGGAAGGAGEGPAGAGGGEVRTRFEGGLP
ncbi:MAG TPA: alanine racemase [Thermoanaerobaculia bacterium]|nr:alanine racemase [Thermoanaerobaculia bacterium]